MMREVEREFNMGIGAFFGGMRDPFMGFRDDLRDRLDHRGGWPLHPHMPPPSHYAQAPYNYQQ
jgi:hypothetical protein